MEYELVLSNDRGRLVELSQWLDQLTAAVSLTESRAAQMRLAVEEAVVNVLNYAYPPTQQGMIRVSAELEGDAVAVVIDDEGTPFDPTEAAEPDVTLPPEERPIGGLGILLVRQLSSSVSYQRRDGHNVLTLVFKN